MASAVRISPTASNSGRNMDPAGKRASSSGSACSASTVSSPSSRSSRSTPPSSAPVSRTRSWLDGSCPGTLSRAGVVRYGPCTRKPRNVSFSVGKDTISGELSTGTRRPASTRKAISTGGASSSARRCQASHSSAALPSLDSVTRRGPGPPAVGNVETDRSMTERRTPVPPTRSRAMLRRNSRIRGWTAVSAAEISRAATAAGTSSWSKGKTNSVPAEGGASGSTGNGRT